MKITSALDPITKQISNSNNQFFIKLAVFFLALGWFLFGSNQIATKVYACIFNVASNRCTGSCPAEKTCQLVEAQKCECRGEGYEMDSDPSPTLNPLSPTPVIRCNLNVNGLTQSSSASDPIRAYEVLANQTYANAFSLAGQKNNVNYQSNLQIFRSPMRKECWYGTDYDKTPTGCPADVPTENAFPLRSVTGAYTLTTNFNTTDSANTPAGDYHIVCYSFDPADVEHYKCSGNPWITPPVANFQYCGDSSRAIVHVLGPTLTPACISKTLGDANCDGKTDDIDYGAWYSQFTSAQDGYGDKSASFDLNERVDLIDFEIWRKNTFINSIPSPTGLPTPANLSVSCSFENNDTYGNFCWDTGNGVVDYNLRINADPQTDYLPPPGGSDSKDLWLCALPTPTRTCYRQKLVDGQNYGNWDVGSSPFLGCGEPRYFSSQQASFTCSSLIPTVIPVPTITGYLLSSNGKSCKTYCSTKEPSASCVEIYVGNQSGKYIRKNSDGECESWSGNCETEMLIKDDKCKDEWFGTGETHTTRWTYCRCSN